MRAWRLVAPIVLSALLTPGVALAEVGPKATLSVLATPVERVPAGGFAAERGVDGLNLSEGDRIKTGNGGLALITFLDGSTVTVLPASEVTVKQAGSDRRQRGIRLLIHAGQVWARVAEALGRRSTLSLESNDYAATAHDGLIGAGVGADGFMCWSRRGEIRVTDRGNFTDAVIVAGRRAWVRHGWPVTPEPFTPSASRLEIRTSGPVVPLVRMPDGRAAAGFLAEDVEVNQVFGSLTERQRGNRWLVEVPGGHEGAYTLVLTGTGTGSFTVDVTSRYSGLRAHHQQIRADARPGERQVTRITHDLSGRDPHTARVVRASVEDLKPWDGTEPAAVVATPDGAPHPTAN